MSLSALIKSQLGYKSMIENAYENYKKSPKERLCKESYLLTRLDSLEEKWQIFAETHKKMSIELSEQLVESKYYKESVYESVEEMYIDYKSDIREALFVLKTQASVSSSCSHLTSKVESNVIHSMATSSNAVAKFNCPYCNNEHKISNCKEFAAVGYNTRHNFVQDNGLCFNCLGRNHSANTCRLFTRCRICKHKHHSLLHPKPITETQKAVLSKPDLSVEVKSVLSKIKTAQEKPESTTNITAHFSKKIVPNQILLATALVVAEARNGYAHLIRALLDQGSQASFVTESTVQVLGLRKIPNPSFQIQVRAHVLGSITSLLPSEKLVNVDWPELANITLADPQFYSPSKIDVLLGADVYSQVIREGLVKGPNGIPTAQCTALGWILSGPTQLPDHNQTPLSHCHHNIISMHSQTDDNELLKRFWQIESDFRESKILNQEEQRCEEYYSNTTQRDPTGRYIVRLPFREDNPQCKYGNSRDIAIKRFHLLENRFKKNSEFKARYSEVIHEYLNLSQMQLITGSDLNKSESVYLPHHAVIREDKITTKVRVVFDASCKGTNGVSLNDTLMIGPTLQQDLRHIIIRWRMHPICLSADIMKMYRQIIVADQDTDFQRLVWRDEPESEIKEFKLVRVTFGTSSAPYLAVKTLHQVTIDEGKEFPNVAETVKTDFYVDDLLTGCQTVEEGKGIYEDMKRLLKKGGFELQKWVTNNKDLAEEIMDGHGKEVGKVDIKIDKVVKVLGLFWDKETDNFQYSVQLPELNNPITKRKVVTSISRLFDPLGWLAPCIITAKVMIQKLWLAGIDWDDELPDELLKEWNFYTSELINIRELSIPRWLKTKVDDTCMELQGFCDASNSAYAAVVYLRAIDAKGNIHVNLVTAKTKVAPTMQISIPRLELMGAVLLAKLITNVANILGIDHNNIHGWTDSTVVLAWLSSHPSRWTTFIGNRTSDVLSNLDNTQWAHVRSAQNPADLASRGCTPLELAENSLWLQGPSWLKDGNIIYKRPKSISTTLEQRKLKVHAVTNSQFATDFDLWKKFSSLQRLIRVVAFCRRFLRYKRNSRFKPYLTSTELQESLDVCIKQCQLADLRDAKQKLKPLSPFLDDKGIMRVGGRIQNANLPTDTKHPIILPHKSHFTNLVIDEAHRKTLHGGPTLMLNHLRTKYWIISAKSLVKMHVRNCVVCVRQAAVTKNQFMGQLPFSRVTPARPFLHSGVDFAGPINVRMSKGRGNKSYKGYISLFVYMATKAIHLELINDLTSDVFIAGFKRFVARRGHVSEIWSDNGTNFVGASKELLKFVTAEQSSVALEIREWLSNNSVSWHFIPAHAPNFGGLWEAGVKAMKFHLKRVIGVSTMTYEELTTVLTQIEACLNSRPLSILPDNHSDPAPLTPGHFLVGEALVIVPERNYEHSNISTLRRWQMTQRMVQDFWRRWSKEYLVNCLQRYKWSKIIPEPEIGNIVLIKEDNLPPGRWLLGRVVAKHPGLDQITRVVTLKCGQSLLKRPTSRLCILPVTQ
ncbi:unnamed protein product [Parnassius mnemosyne]|uniref:Integrase catalytic domain-containing protein n=1 Tax=Parnassius mnemosyne TaxID=213953 RepID=A0AAV1L8H1_9NEOP